MPSAKGLRDPAGGASEQALGALLFQQSGTGQALLDRAGRVLRVNPALAAFLGTTAEALVGLDARQLVGTARDRRPIAGLDPDGEALRALPFVRHDNEARVWALTRVDWLRDDEGAPAVGMLVVQDVTAAKAERDERGRDERLESLAVLAGGVAHEFNNILTAVLGNVSLAQAAVGPGRDELAELLHDALDATEQARHLMLQLLAFAKGGVTRREPVALARLVDEAVRETLSAPELRLDVIIGLGLYPIRGDDSQLVQVLRSLMTQAADAAGDGGAVRVEARNVTLEPADPVPLPPGPYVCVTVWDDGRPVAEGDLGRLFDPFYPARQRRGGLGLASAHTVVTKHGGHLGVCSSAEAGTTFLLYLPTDTSKHRRGPLRADSSLRRRREQGRRVLLMDDEPVVRIVAQRMLVRLGCEAVGVANGREAVQAYRAELEAGSPFDLVILDLTVPNGMGGAEAMRRILELDPGASGVVSSGYALDPVMAEHRTHGFRASAVKPYTLGELRRVLAELLGGAAGRV